MYIAKLVNNLGFAIKDEDYEKRKVWNNGIDNPAHIQCSLEDGIIVLIPEHLWTRVETESEENGNK